MTTDDMWLIDKSALYRLSASVDAELWLDRINRGLVQISAPTMLEIGYSARNADDWDSGLTSPPVSLMPLTGITPAAELRAIEVQGILARRGYHRAPSVPDLLIAAIAEVSGLVVVHVDKDFDVIAGVTGQSVERLRIQA